MLILSRKIDEEILIGDSIRIKVLAVHDGQVKIGIEAPKNVKVFRTEVYNLILQQNTEAVKASKATAQKVADALKKSRTPKGASF